jgi:hypothetical protein
VIRRLLTLLTVITLLAPAVAAHDVVVDQVVLIAVEQQADQLLIRLHVPVSVFGNAALPPVEDVAADIARSLDVRLAAASLPAPVATARLAGDQASVDIALLYASRADAPGLSARLNVFAAGERPVRTVLRQRLTSGREHTLSVTGPPVRVTFDPDTRDVLGDFTARGVRTLLGAADALLFLVCVLLTVRRARSAAALFGALALGQSITLAIALALPVLSPDSLTALAMVAASAVVIAALQVVVRAQLRWTFVLTFAFGVLSGFAFGNTLSASTPFAGSHVIAGSAAFAGLALLGEFWFGAIAWATRAWLDERGVSERIVTVLGSLLIAHTALHLAMDRGSVLAESGGFGGERALIWVTLGWVCVMLVFALSNFVRGRTVSPAALGAAPESAEAL